LRDLRHRFEAVDASRATTPENGRARAEPWETSITARSDHPVPSISERYRVERELGSGGMATVYLAVDLKHHRKVAVKVMKPEIAKAIGNDRFLREIEIAARLNHPHVLPLFDSGAAGELLYYVTPYIEGDSLRARLGRET